MPKETDRLKLPLPLGNENVTRESINGIFEKIDAGVATQADLDALREAVSQMDIPDASLTQKGKVQLSSKTDGPSETVAATEKAVRDARVAAISVAAADAATKANAAVEPIISMDSSNLVQNSSANLGLYGWTDYGASPWSVVAGTNFRTLKYFQVTGAVAANAYAVLDSNTTNVIAGIYNLQAMFYTLGMTTGVMLIEVKNASDDVTINSLVADSNSNWHRKSKTVTIPSGVTSVKLRLVVAGGTSGVPGSVKAISRIKFSAGAVDVPYSAEADDLALFQSGVDAKNGIVGAINVTGGTASTSDTWATLASKLYVIKDPFLAFGDVTTYFNYFPSNWSFIGDINRGLFGSASDGSTIRLRKVTSSGGYEEMTPINSSNTLSYLPRMFAAETLMFSLIFWSVAQGWMRKTQISSWPTSAGSTVTETVLSSFLTSPMGGTTFSSSGTENAQKYNNELILAMVKTASGIGDTLYIDTYSEAGVLIKSQTIVLSWSSYPYTPYVCMLPKGQIAVFSMGSNSAGRYRIYNNSGVLIREVLNTEIEATEKAQSTQYIKQDDGTKYAVTRPRINGVAAVIRPYKGNLY